MRTTRNIFIANLAISDILLCTFTMPLTISDLFTKYWPLGEDMVGIIRLIYFIFCLKFYCGANDY